MRDPTNSAGAVLNLAAASGGAVRCAIVRPESGTEADAPLLDATQAMFLSGPIAINVASHDADLVPSIARAYGCRISSDRRQVAVFVSTMRSRELLRDLRAGSPIAVVFTRPKTHATLQLKGTRAEILPLAPGDREIIRAYGAAFAGEIRDLGFADHFTRAMLAPAEEDALAVVFTPAAMFEQTPGPVAGKRLKP
jgi:hypothetical protein